MDFGPIFCAKPVLRSRPDICSGCKFHVRWPLRCLGWDAIPLAANPHAIAAVYNYPIGKVYVASQNSSFLTIIRTDTDIVSDTMEMEGNIVDMHVNSQYPGQASGGALNYVTESRSVGSGAP